MSAADSTHDTILVLDDTKEMAELIGELATRAGYGATVTTDIEAFNAAMKRDVPNVIALDLQMPEADGVEVLRLLSAAGCQSRILIITGMDARTIATAERFARKAGLNLLGSIQKPFDPEVLIGMLRNSQSLAGQLSIDDLGTAIHDATLSIRYQPVVRRIGRRTWHAESVEALPRWKHPHFGMLTPAQFLPLIGSDRSTIMRELADYVLQQGAEQLRQWQGAGLHLGLRINMPAGLINDIAFPDRLDRLLQEYNADPSLLTLELADTIPMTQSKDGIEILTRLRLKDIRLALDDFGANGSMLQSLYTLPINEVKIDRCMTADLIGEQAAPVVFRSILELLESLGIESCAEGVETSEELKLLDELKCDLAQGFYIGTPMPAADIPKALSSWTAETIGQTKTG